MSEETKMKISIAKSGKNSKPFSLEHRMKISRGASLNHRKYNTMETRIKISQSCKGRIAWNKGKKCTDVNVLLKRSQSLKEYYSKNPSEVIRLKNQRAKIIYPTKDTSIEIKIQNYLKELGIDFFTHQYIKDIEHGYQCDILIPSRNLVIECDGDYWHHYPIGNEMDHIRTKELLDKGFKVLRLWECEINIITKEQLKEKIETS